MVFRNLTNKKAPDENRTHDLLLSRILGFGIPVKFRTRKEKHGFSSVINLFCGTRS